MAAGCRVSLPLSFLKGKSVSGFREEKWLDIRRWDLLGPIMRARAEKCRYAGFDGIEWDNVDGYTNKTGFPLTADPGFDGIEWDNVDGYTNETGFSLRQRSAILQREPRELGS